MAGIGSASGDRRSRNQFHGANQSARGGKTFLLIATSRSAAAVARRRCVVASWLSSWSHLAGSVLAMVGVIVDKADILSAGVGVAR